MKIYICVCICMCVCRYMDIGLTDVGRILEI